MVPERRGRPRQRTAGPLCGRYGSAGADGTTGTGGVGATAGAVRGSSIGGEPGEESADNAGRRFCVSRLRVPESSGADAVSVAARKGVPQYPPTAPRSSAIVSVQWVRRRGDPEAESGPEWVVYLFPGREQQPDIP